MGSSPDFVILRLVRGDSWSPGTTPGLLLLQVRHMWNLLSLRRRGLMVVGGPVFDEAGLRGLVVVPAGREAEARAALAHDPAVRAGRLRVAAPDEASREAEHPAADG